VIGKKKTPASMCKPFAKRVEDLSQSPIPQGLGDFFLLFSEPRARKTP
jgi:hypothetical protein